MFRNLLSGAFDCQQQYVVPALQRQVSLPLPYSYDANADGIRRCKPTVKTVLCFARSEVSQHMTNPR